MILLAGCSCKLLDSPIKAELLQSLGLFKLVLSKDDNLTKFFVTVLALPTYSRIFLPTSPGTLIRFPRSQPSPSPILKHCHHHNRSRRQQYSWCSCWLRKAPSSHSFLSRTRQTKLAWRSLLAEKPFLLIFFLLCSLLALVLKKKNQWHSFHQDTIHHFIPEFNHH